MGKGGGEGGGGVKGGLGVMEIFMRDLTDGTEQGGGGIFRVKYHSMDRISKLFIFVLFLELLERLANSYGQVSGH